MSASLILISNTAVLDCRIKPHKMPSVSTLLRMAFDFSDFMHMKPHPIRQWPLSATHDCLVSQGLNMGYLSIGFEVRHARNHARMIVLMPFLICSVMEWAMADFTGFPYLPWLKYSVDLDMAYTHGPMYFPWTYLARLVTLIRFFD